MRGIQVEAAKKKVTDGLTPACAGNTLYFEPFSPLIVLVFIQLVIANYQKASDISHCIFDNLLTLYVSLLI